MFRLKEDNSREVLSFDVNDALSGVNDIVLKREDVVEIISKLDLKESFNITITGEVLRPGTFDYADNMTVEDLIVAAGGLKDNASTKKIEIARRIKTEDPNAPALSVVKTYDVNEDLKTREGDRIILMPFDIVSVYALPGYHVQRNITIEGEVSYPGQYTLTKSDERISEILKRAGGITRYGFVDGAVLLRTQKITGVDELIRKQKLDVLLKQTKDTARAQQTVLSQESENANLISLVGIDLQKILKHPGSKHDIVLNEDDILRVPRVMQTVRVSGEVLYPVRIIHKKGKSFKRYVSEAGGYTQKALKRRAYVVYANGVAAGTKKILFFNSYPKVKPGSEIIVPPRQDREKISAQEMLAIITGTATLIVLALTVAK